MFRKAEDKLLISSCPVPSIVEGSARPFVSVYALTRICRVGYTKGMESVFAIIAEPNRRAILSLLASSEQSVGEIERQLRMPQPTVSKHLRVLREAGFVESTVDAQRRLYRLRPEPLQELDAWLAPFRRFWSAHVDALERHLDRMDQSPPTKKKNKEKKDDRLASSTHRVRPAGRRYERTERSGRSFSSGNCATRRKKSGRR